jgi:gliding motility-associated-like protein
MGFIKHLFNFILLLFVFKANAQLSVQITNTDSMVTCTNNCKTIKATHPKPKSTNDYNISSIPYASISLPTPVAITLGDDVFSPPIPMGFDFCFFGVPYSNCVIGSNGLIAFNTGFANQPCFSNTAINFPYSGGTFPPQVIACPFIDIDPSQGGSISYQTIGVAPYRKFIVKFTNVLLFGATSSVSNNFYTVLNETYNTIEIHIGNKGITSNTNPTSLDSSVLGIQNAALLNYVCAPNKNGGVWTSINEAWLFTPSGLTNNFSVEWYVNGVFSVAASDSALLCFNSSGKNTVVCKYVSLCPSSFVLTDTFFVYKPAVSIDSITKISPVCKYNKGTVIIHASSQNQNLSYSTDGIIFSPSNTYPNLPISPPIYTFTVKDGGGCTASTNLIIASLSNVKAIPINVIDANCFINNGSACASVSNGFPPYSFLWKTGDTTLCVDSVAGLTILGFKVTDSLGCIDSINISVGIIYPVINIDTMIKPICPLNLGTIALSAYDGIPPYIFIWQNFGDTAAVKTNLAGNTAYTVTVIDATGCSTTKIIFLPSVSLVTVTLTGIKPTCKKSNGSITTTVSNGTAPYTYLWNNMQTTANLTNIDSNAYFVAVKDANGCPASATLLLKDTLNMNLSGTKVNTSCGYINGSATVNAFNGQAPYNYVWTPLALNNPTNVNLAPGSYFVTVTDALQCTKTFSYQISSSPLIQLQALTVNPFCDSANGKITLIPSNGFNPYSYNWSGGGPNNATWNNIIGGNYTVTVTDANNCSTSISIVLLDQGSPKISVLTYLPPLCHGDSSGQLELVGSGSSAPYKYSKDGINFFTSANFSNIYAGTFTFFIKDANSCTKDSTIILGEPLEINIDLDLDDTLICYYDKIPKLNFPASGGFPPYVYRFDNSGFGPKSFAEDVGIGAHKIFVLDSVLCERIFEINVIGPPAPLQAAVEKRNVACLIDSSGYIKANISGGWGKINYTWSQGDTGLILENLPLGVYTLKLKDSLGCEVVNDILVTRDTCCIATMANAFSPNDDFINDDIGILSITPLEEVNLKIFNRWGKLLFQTDDVSKRWDAKKGGTVLDPDIYFYILNYKCSSSKKTFTAKGDIQIIK